MCLVWFTAYLLHNVLKESRRGLAATVHLAPYPYWSRQPHRFPFALLFPCKTSDVEMVVRAGL